MGGKICLLGEPCIGWFIHFCSFVPQVLTVFVMNGICQSQEEDLVDSANQGVQWGCWGAGHRWVDILTPGPAQKQQGACRAPSRQRRDRHNNGHSRAFCAVANEPQSTLQNPQSLNNSFLWLEENEAQKPLGGWGMAEWVEH